MTIFAINNSEVPVVRAGSSNLVWPIIAIALFMLVRASELPPSGRLTISAFMLLTITLGIWLFMTTVARLTFSDDAIDILRAITRETIRYEQVDFVELTRMRLAPLLRIRIMLKMSGRKLQLT